MSKPTFRIPVSNGLLEHCAVMGEAIWYFLWAIDKTTKEKTDADGTGNLIGAVLGGMPVRDEIAARELGREVKTIRRWRKHLTEQGYIETRRTPVGYVVWVKKSKKKWVKDPGLDKNVQSDRTKMSTQAGSDLPLGEIRKDICGSRFPFSGTPYRQSIDSTETEQKEREKTTSLSLPPKPAGKVRVKDLVKAALTVNDKAMCSLKSQDGLKSLVAEYPTLDREDWLGAVRSLVLKLNDFQLENCGSNLVAMLPAAIEVRAEQIAAAARLAAAELASRVAGQAAHAEEERQLQLQRAEDSKPIDEAGLFDCGVVPALSAVSK